MAEDRERFRFARRIVCLHYEPPKPSMSTTAEAAKHCPDCDDRDDCTMPTCSDYPPDADHDQRNDEAAAKWKAEGQAAHDVAERVPWSAIENVQQQLDAAANNTTLTDGQREAIRFAECYIIANEDAAARALAANR